MLRHEALHPLSRDHSVGLVLARRLIREESADDLIRGWLYELDDHFTQEERLLTPLIADAAVRSRFQEDHALFRAYVQQIVNGDRSREAQIEAGKLLDEHIRWEEEVLFPHVEQAATEAQLAYLRTQTDLIEAERAGCPLEPKRGRIVANRMARFSSLRP